VIVLPLLGVLVYLIARGAKMQERQARLAQRQEEKVRAYIRDTAGGGAANELAKLVELKEHGDISQAEFEQGKAKILS
jgi:hypothetical protein